MEIQEVIRYKYEGKEYNSLKEVRTEVENRLGAIIDKISPPLTFKQRLAILETLVNNKDEIKALLDVEYFSEAAECNRNVLDY